MVVMMLMRFDEEERWGRKMEKAKRFMYSPTLPSSLLAALIVCGIDCCCPRIVPPLETSWT